MGSVGNTGSLELGVRARAEERAETQGLIEVGCTSKGGRPAELLVEEWIDLEMVDSKKGKIDSSKRTSREIYRRPMDI